MSSPLAMVLPRVLPEKTYPGITALLLIMALIMAVGGCACPDMYQRTDIDENMSTKTYFRVGLFQVRGSNDRHFTHSILNISR